MNEQYYYALLVLLFGILIFCFGCFMTKDRFFNAKGFETLKDILPFPTVINFWVFKIFLFIGSFLVILAGIYGVIVNI